MKTVPEMPAQGRNLEQSGAYLVARVDAAVVMDEAVSGDTASLFSAKTVDPEVGQKQHYRLRQYRALDQPGGQEAV